MKPKKVNNIKVPIYDVHHCVICGNNIGPNDHCINTNTKYYLFCNKGVLIPPNPNTVIIQIIHIQMMI